MNDLTFLSAAEMAHQIRQKKVSPVELAEAHLSKMSSEGLPIGVQIVGRPWQEEQVLTIAAALERECGGFKVPPLV